MARHRRLKKYALRSFSEVGPFNSLIQKTVLSSWQEKIMYYVYLLRSQTNPDKTYIGYTTDINSRLNAHNYGETAYTADFRPWCLVSYVALDTKEKALSFERYLKVGSGHAFAQKRLW